MQVVKVLDQIIPSSYQQLSKPLFNSLKVTILSVFTPDNDNLIKDID